MIAELPRNTAPNPKYPKPWSIKLDRTDGIPLHERFVGWREEGLCAVEFTERISLATPASARRGLETIRAVRDCVALGIAVDWHTDGLGPLDPRLLAHLPQPHGALSSGPAAFCFGLLYWRRGPGFARVRDVRPDFDAGELTLEAQDGVLPCFLRLQAPAELDAMDDVARAATRYLVNERLAIERFGCALALPYRIYRWPMPFSAI